jgi:hypothetical protein
MTKQGLKSRKFLENHSPYKNLPETGSKEEVSLSKDSSKKVVNAKSGAIEIKVGSVEASKDEGTKSKREL